MSQTTDALGVAGSGKYFYQSGRAAQGLSTTTRLTAGLDLLSGSFGVGEAQAATDAIRGVSSASKGAAGAARLSTMARVASVAGKAAPIVARGAAVVGGVLGGIEIAHGAGDLKKGASAEGREHLVNGTTDVITAGALGVAATSSATVVGAPVAAAALGVAGLAQGAKYVYRYHDEIGQGLHWGGDRVAEAAGGLRDVASKGLDTLKGLF